MAATTKVTTDRDEIRRWAEEHGGRPAAVKKTGRGEDPGILRIDFPGFSGEGKLEPIRWDRFFKWFETNELALLYRPNDRFNKLVSRETARGKRTAPVRASSKRQASAKRAGKRQTTTRKTTASTRSTTGRARKTSSRSGRP